MNKAFVNFTWYDKPDVRSPLAALYLNRINNGLNTVDDRVILLDTNKANQTDELQDIKSVSYNSTTGVWIFTHQDGTTDTFNQNVEKIPVSFSMSVDGIITMETADGTQYTADVGSLIKIYNFNDTDIIDFTTDIDTYGNRTITATIKDGSITGAKLQPNYLADITVQAQNAAASASAASDSANDADYDAQLSKSYAIGDETVRPGSSTDNAKYYKEQAAAIVGATGHVILDGSNTTMPARTTLQFINGVGTDDSTNDITKIAWAINDTEWTQIETILA